MTNMPYSAIAKKTPNHPNEAKDDLPMTTSKPENPADTERDIMMLQPLFFILEPV